MIHTYHHTFQDGVVMSLAVDLSRTPPVFVGTHGVAASHADEYVRWVHEVVLEDLVPRLNPAQMASLAIKGYEMINPGDSA